MQRAHTPATVVRNVLARKWSFLAAFFIMLVLAISALGAADLLPEPRATEPAPEISLSASPLVGSPAAAPAQPAAAAKKEFPQRLSIPSIGLSVDIHNPAKTDIATLDEALLAGVVRYPTSATLGTKGNVVIFGHSSYLPVVHNPAFKAFTGIEKLRTGDRITVYGSVRAYVYAVEEVGSADADSDAIPLSVEGSILTLSTCDSFGKKTDRFIVVARLIETRDL